MQENEKNLARKLGNLNRINDVRIYSVKDNEFQSYGRVVKGYDFSGLCKFLEEETLVPESGNCYVASVPKMERLEIAEKVQQQLYGGMEIQIGYCNGQNTTYNGFEYHKGSEINVAVTDFMLVLGHTWEIKDKTYHIADAKVFFVEKGTAIEMYQTTLHLSPCKISDAGFKDVVILPRGTNTPLGLSGLEQGSELKKQTGLDWDNQLLERSEPDQDSKLIEKSVECDQESELLLQKNKWVIAHPDREPLIRQGAYPGLLGENKELHYE